MEAREVTGVTPSVLYHQHGDKSRNRTRGYCILFDKQRFCLSRAKRGLLTYAHRKATLWVIHYYPTGQYCGQLGWGTLKDMVQLAYEHGPIRTNVLKTVSRYHYPVINFPTPEEESIWMLARLVGN